jgi:uncharacterized protein (DUF1330 family)
MPKAYILVAEDIHDPEGMKAYGAAAMPTIAEHKAVVLSVGPAEVLEGSWNGQQTILLEFESVEAAKAWYESDGYQAAAKLRQAAADSNAVLLQGR